MNFEALYQQVLQWLTSSGLKVLLIVILGFVALRIVKVVAKRLFSTVQKKKPGVEGEKRAETLSSLVRYVLSIGILITAGIMILGQLGIEIGPILAAAGVIGLAVGFGAQRLVQDVISGFFILIEDQVRVGDVVHVAGKGGLVEKVNIRMTVLRDLAGNVHYVRNSQIDIVTNMTKDFSRYVFDIGVAYREDVDEVISVVKEVDEELRSDEDYKDDILEPIEILGLDEFADSAVIIKARIMTKPIKQWRIGREFNRRLKRKFDQVGIEIPFPHRTLYMGQGKKGEAAPLNVAVAGERAV
ncbi:MAG: mechanosensitive ion channel [Candidatus Latescibacteria bacterium]|nr:mechanosensitive ion channel [Candidatus Latescibacterota bacterium]NIO57354.1 mechanosensitive ion channel [Candidatus Latescibacterota bacterium]